MLQMKSEENIIARKYNIHKVLCSVQQLNITNIRKIIISVPSRSSPTERFSRQYRFGTFRSNCCAIPEAQQSMQ